MASPMDVYHLPPRQRRAVAAIGRAAIPAGEVTPTFDEGSLQRVEEGLGWMEPAIRLGHAALVNAVRSAVFASTGRRLSRARPTQVASVIGRIARSGRVGRLAMDGLLAPLKVAHFSDPEYFRHFGCPYDLDEPADEPARWHGKVLDGADLSSGEEVVCDVAIVGSGAGGSVVACRLAEAGYAVLLLEEGGFHRRCHFKGRPTERLRSMYRSMGLLPLHGNTRLTLPLGRTLGGSTTINSATCYRAPDGVLDRWVRDHGLDPLAPDALAPYYERAEQVLEIGPCEPDLWGGVAAAVIRGCDRLGWAHAPVKRNAPECDGQATCAFGCPSGAKRSADVSYIPQALRSGAFAVTGAEVRGVLWDGRRACGVEVRTTTPDGDPRTARVRSRAVVLAAGTVHTPVLLGRNLPGRPPPALGRNLTVHPACMLMAVMDEPVRGWEGVPQSYAIEEFRDEGLLFEGGFTPPDVASAMIGVAGQRCTELMDRFDHLAYFGAMIGDTSTGRVFPLSNGDPILTYWLNRGDTLLLNRGLRLMARVFLAAGASEVIPQAGAWPRLRSRADLDRLGRQRFGPGQLDLTAFHPLGTCRMGLDPDTSVVSADHTVHGARDCYVVDGSVIPSSLSVNPQLTIFAMAERASEIIERRLAEEKDVVG